MRHWRLPFVLILLGTLLGLTPVAYSSPEDPAWISGYYDDVDYDDVVVAVTSASGVVEHLVVEVVRPFFIAVGFLPLASFAATPAVTRSAFQTRAPPLPTS